MEPVKKINLIQTKFEMSSQTGMTIRALRKLSLWALLLLSISGIFVSGTYYYMLIRRDQLTSTKQRLSDIIAQNPTKEGLLVSVQQRSALITKIFGVQKPVSKVFDTVDAFVSGSQMSVIALDDRNIVSLSIHAQSITEVISITDMLITQAAQNQVKAPQLVSLTLGKDGGVDLGLSFTAVF